MLRVHLYRVEGRYYYYQCILSRTDARSVASSPSVSLAVDLMHREGEFTLSARVHRVLAALTRFTLVSISPRTSVSRVVCRVAASYAMRDCKVRWQRPLLKLTLFPIVATGRIQPAGAFSHISASASLRG